MITCLTFIWISGFILLLNYEDRQGWETLTIIAGAFIGIAAVLNWVERLGPKKMYDRIHEWIASL